MNRRSTLRASRVVDLMPVVALGSSLACAGCALTGARTDLKADAARYPISMTSALPDQEGRVLRKGHELSARGPFEAKGTAYNFLYGATPAAVEISDAVNAQVAAAGGEGIVDLEVEASSCAWAWVVPFNLLPFWPGCVDMRIRGVIVSRKQALSVAALPAVAPEEGPR